jgi:glycosyltransferase involved in cell wall biosynthesis
MPRVLLVRGHLVTPWELRPWSRLPDRFDVSYLLTPSNEFDPSAVPLRATKARTLRDVIRLGPVGPHLSGVLGERYLGVDAMLAGADVVHAEELSFWFAADVARRKPRHGYKLVQTVWETLPFLETYRSRRARRYRQQVLAATDLFLPATGLAREALLLEGVPEERIDVCPPGIDVERFAVPPPDPPPSEHVILSAGRLVWEKGHQDVLRALALLHGDRVGDGHRPRVVLVGSGPEEDRLRAYARELGIEQAVELRSVPYEEMPAVFASASCLVLASLPKAGGGLHPVDVPRIFWEEQFGMVLAEAMAAGLPILASSSGAIPEVVGPEATMFAPGDWRALARALAAGPLSRPPAARASYPRELVHRYSLDAMAARLTGAYDRLLS